MDAVTDDPGTAFRAAHDRAQRALSSIACAPHSTSEEHRCRRCRSLYGKLAALDDLHARGAEEGLLEGCKALLNYLAELESATDRVWPESNERESPEMDLPLFDVSNDPFARPVASTAATSKPGRRNERDEPPRKRQRAGMSQNPGPLSPASPKSSRPTRRNGQHVFTPGVYYRQPRSQSQSKDGAIEVSVSASVSATREIPKPEYVPGVHYRADKIAAVATHHGQPAPISSSASVSAPIPISPPPPSSPSSTTNTNPAHPLPVRTPSPPPTNPSPNQHPSPITHTSRPPRQPQPTRPKRQSTKKIKYHDYDYDSEDEDVRPRRGPRGRICDILSAAAAAAAVSSSSHPSTQSQPRRSKAKTRKWQEKPFGVLLPIILCEEHAYVFELPPEVWERAGGDAGGVSRGNANEVVDEGGNDANGTEAVYRRPMEVPVVLVPTVASPGMSPGKMKGQSPLAAVAGAEPGNVGDVGGVEGTLDEMDDGDAETMSAAALSRLSLPELRAVALRRGIDPEVVARVRAEAESGREMSGE